MRRLHETVDLDHWIGVFPLASVDDVNWPIEVSSPRDLAFLEQVRRMARSEDIDLGESVPVDMFLWRLGTPSHDRGHVTKIGDVPYRDRDKPWPLGDDGHPLTFIGQICFADSRDLLRHELPGDVLLLFARYQCQDVFDYEGSALEWSRIGEVRPARCVTDCPASGILPVAYEGVIHRTVQYPWADEAYPFCNGGGDATAFQIGSRCALPQGWNWETGDDPLLCVFNSFRPSTEWPFVNCERLAERIGAAGNRYRDNVYHLDIVGGYCMYVWVHESGEFRLRSEFA